MDVPRQLRDAVDRHPFPLVFATISGAHLYGFASLDSDVDLRGAFILPARELLGLHPPKETVTIEDKLTIDLDWVAPDIRKFARMMVSHNGYVLCARPRRACRIRSLRDRQVCEPVRSC
jgi:predicted nucleotidyltransferase